MPELAPETLAHFLRQLEEKRKAIPSSRRIEKEAGLHQATLIKLINGTLELTEERKSKLIPVLKQYGFNPE